MKIATLAGDGVGPEVMSEALRVLEAISDKFNHKFEIRHALVGGAAYDVHATHLPTETLEICKNSDAILFGSVGGPISESDLPKWKGCEVNALLGIRKAFNFYANLRPCDVFPELTASSPLKDNIISNGASILIIRELIGDIYFGEKKRETRSGKRYASDLAEYNEVQISNIAKIAFEAARKRKFKVTSVDKANVLETSRLWREVVTEVSKSYLNVSLEHMLVDNCAMQLVKNPSQFDVLLCSNMFGDILSDIGSVLPGSLGMTPSASLNLEGFGLYEPSGGSAPDIAGKGVANPCAQILSLALMLRFSLKLEEEALAIEDAVKKTLKNGFRTADLAQKDMQPLSTTDFTNQIIKNLKSAFY